MFPYISLTEQDEREMLEKIGVESIDDLFRDIPEDVSLNRPLDLPKAKSELEVTSYLRGLANQNLSICCKPSFLGAGAYDHYIPTIIKHITGRSEFYTSYTPYQPEVSQGTLQYIFEYQTLITRLTGMDIANASLYDGGTAIGEAAIMCVNSNKKKNVVISKTVHPNSRMVARTYLKAQGFELIEVDMKDGVTDMDALAAAVTEDTGAVVIQSPNFFGYIEDVAKATEIAHATKKNSMILSVDPTSLGIMKKPSEFGVDVVVGEAQPFGIPVALGGPYLGFIAVNKAYLRKLPGRIVGQTEDRDGKRCWVLTLSAREQHIRREKATSNICSNQGLNVLAATVYMVTMGKKGIREMAELSAKKAHYCFNELTKSGKFKPLSTAPFFKEFTVVSDKSTEELNAKLKEAGIVGGFAASKFYEGIGNATVIAVTEKRTKDEIDQFVKVMEEA
ncbi:MAG: aminomethyl-transferring glycine dehydrogenase subunit GcvPA [Tissierellia bacterium]|nr:aminomethyl-transferring glycine dehydrogenase subunit GcvPA [Tissierellia bacterium]